MIGNFLANFEKFNSYVKTALATFGKICATFTPTSGHTRGKPLKGAFRTTKYRSLTWVTAKCRYLPILLTMVSRKIISGHFIKQF